MGLCVVLLLAALSEQYSSQTHVHSLDLNMEIEKNVMWVEENAAKLTQTNVMTALVRGVSAPDDDQLVGDRSLIDVLTRLLVPESRHSNRLVAQHIHGLAPSLQDDFALKFIVGNEPTPEIPRFDWSKTEFKSSDTLNTTLAAMLAGVKDFTDYLGLEKVLQMRMWSLATNRQVRNQILVQLSQWLCIAFSHPDDTVAFSNLGYVLHLLGDTFSDSHVRRSISHWTKPLAVTRNNCKLSAIRWIFSADSPSRQHDHADEVEDDWRFECLKMHVRYLIRTFHTSRRVIRDMLQSIRGDIIWKESDTDNRIPIPAIDRLNTAISQSVGAILNYACTDILNFESPEYLDFPAGGAPGKFRSRGRLLPTGLVPQKMLDDLMIHVIRPEMRKRYSTYYPNHVEGFWYVPQHHPDYCEAMLTSKGPWMCPAFEMNAARAEQNDVLYHPTLPWLTNIGSRFFRFDDDLRKILMAEGGSLIPKVEAAIAQAMQSFSPVPVIINRAMVLNSLPTAYRKSNLPFSMNHVLLGGLFGALGGSFLGIIANAIKPIVVSEVTVAGMLLGLMFSMGISVFRHIRMRSQFQV